MATNKAGYLHMMLSPAIADTVRRIARAEDRTYSQVVRRALALYAESAGQSNKAA